MNKDQLTDAIGMIDEDLLEEANKTRERSAPKRNSAWKWMTAAACVLLCLVVVFAIQGIPSGGSSGGASGEKQPQDPSAKSMELAFYTQSLEQELQYSEGVFEEIQKEVANQSLEAAKTEGMDIKEELESLNISTVPKAALISTESEKTQEYDNVVEGVLEQLKSARDVVKERSYVSEKSRDPLQSSFLDYCWLIPVATKEDGTVYATVILQKLEHYQVEYSVSGAFVAAEKDYRQYLSDEQMLRDILESSSVPMDYSTVLPVAFPELDMDIILFAAEHEVYGIPFYAASVEPQLENGKIYSFDDIEKGIQGRAEEVTGVKAASAFKKMLSNPVQRIEFIAILLLAAGIGCAVVVCIVRVRKKKAGK